MFQTVYGDIEKYMTEVRLEPGTVSVCLQPGGV